MNAPCPCCDEPLAEDAGWCSLCLRRVLEIEPEELATELRGATRSGWARPERHWYPTPIRRHSRLRSGPLSFGPVVKVAMSLAVVSLLPAMAAQTSFSPLYRNVFLVPTTILVLWLLSQIWKRQRVE